MKNLKSLISSVHCSAVPQVFSKRKAYFSNAEFIPIFLNINTNKEISISALLKSAREGELEITSDLLDLNWKTGTSLYGSGEFFLCLGDKIYIENTLDSNYRTTSIEILEHKGFDLEEWDSNSQKLEQEFVQRWLEWYRRNLGKRAQLRNDLSVDRMIEEILNIETISKSFIDKLSIESYSMSDSFKSNIKKCRYYLERYQSSKDIKYLVEGFSYE